MNLGAADWERMSTVWSVFGIIGAVRAYLKIGAGLAGAEAAGVNLSGGGVYTAKRTKDSQAAVVVGSTDPHRAPQTPAFWWQDDDRQLLGTLKNAHFPWRRPHIIAVGYSKCPFEGRRALREVAYHLTSGVVTIIVTAAPTFVLFPRNIARFYWPVTLGLSAAVSLVAGCALPFLLLWTNPVGVASLRTLSAARIQPQSFMSSQDAVISSIADKTCVLMFQALGDRPWARSGDNWVVRSLAALATAMILLYYCFNYILLGAVDGWRSYTWLGVQIAILLSRYVLWSLKPRFVSHRGLSLLFIAMGSIGPMLFADDDAPTSADIQPVGDRPLSREIVHFAFASATSKLLNAGGTRNYLHFEPLDRLSDVAQSDILRAAYCDVSLIPPVTAKDDDPAGLRIVRLPWSFMEELYAAQGLILGNNPWALGGLYLAAVVRGKDFFGLTTVAPVGAGTQAAIDQHHGLEVTKLPPGTVGMTATGTCVNSLWDGQVLGHFPHAVSMQFAGWHARFRKNVEDCRAAAMPNGPSYCELHVQNFGDGVTGRKHSARTESTLADALKFISTAIEHEKTKNHSRCREHCPIVTFDD